MLELSQAKTTLAEQSWNFTASFETGQRYAILGRSGSGKSTLLNCIGGFLPVQSGEIMWNDESLLNLVPHERPITSLFQKNNLFSHLTVAQNIGLGINPSLHLTEADKKKIDDVLSASGLGGYQNKRPTSLSGGEQQRVALARCLVRKKPILLLDEPFSALDKTTRAAMIAQLNAVINEINPCVLMVTHEQSDAAAIDAKVLWIHDGGIHSEPTMAE